MSTTSIGSSTTAQDMSKLSPAIQQALQGINIKGNKSTLTQDDFLKLLTVQLSNQDPLKPMEDAQFMGQMAQFASLEQTKELNATVTSLGASLGFSSAQQFLGKYVTLNDQGNPVSGLVTDITLSSGAPSVVVGGYVYPTSSVTSVSLAAPASNNSSISK